MVTAMASLQLATFNRLSKHFTNWATALFVDNKYTKVIFPT